MPLKIQDIRFFVIADTNVLISYLPLLRELVNSIARQRLPMAVMLPRVVVSELNFLKERNSNATTRAKAQEANAWLLLQARSGSGHVRGQKEEDQQTKRRSNVRKYRNHVPG